jgi:NADPH2:quinone reductase
MLALFRRTERMKAWRVHRFGEPRDVLVADEVERPRAADLAGYCVDLAGLRKLAGPQDTPVAEWVILRVTAAALGLPDVTMARGSYPVPIERPYTAGLEAAGVVEDAAPSMREWIGKRVVGFTPQPFGALAPVCVGIGSALYEVPAGLSDEEAAAFLIASHTAWHALVRRGGLAAGETVLVLGAAGGLGSAAVQLAAGIGARVVAVVGGEEKARFCLGLGAERALDHTACDFAAAAREHTGGRGVDVVFDPVQGKMGAQARTALAPEGRAVLCGHAGGIEPIDPRSFYMANLTLVGATMGAYPPAMGRAIEADAQRRILALLESGRFKPVVGRVIDFDDVPKAITDLAERRTLGRVVVRF